MEKTDKIYVAGHRGLVGSAIVRSLKKQGYENIIGRSHKELDLTEQAAVRAFFEAEKPDVVVLAAAKVGGINAIEGMGIGAPNSNYYNLQCFNSRINKSLSRVILLCLY